MSKFYLQLEHTEEMPMYYEMPGVFTSEFSQAKLFEPQAAMTLNADLMERDIQTWICPLKTAKDEN